METELPLMSIARSFENNIQAIRVLNETIGCIADDHDKKIRLEFEGKTKAVLDSFLSDIKEKYKDKEVDQKEAKEMKEDLSEEETKKLSKTIGKVLFSDEEFVKAHKYYKKSAPNQGPILRGGALVSLLGCLETTIAKLIREFYRKYPEAFPSDSKSLTLSDLKLLGSIEDAELHLVDSEIDSILRGSVESQIKYFSKPIRIQTKHINIFLDNIVEISQRRNILVHNDGIINKYYTSKTPDDLLSNDVKEGDLIKVDQHYLSDAINMVYIVGVILIQQCFRKWEKEFIEEADTLLWESAFESLVDENYDLTILIAKYSQSIAMESDSNRKILIINHAIALRETGQINEMNILLDEYDWSSVSLRFKLALYALKGEDETFYNTLENTILAKEIECTHLIEWPLFKPYQLTEKFMKIIKQHWPDHTDCSLKES